MTYQKMIVFPLFLSFFRALTALASLKKTWRLVKHQEIQPILLDGPAR